MRGSAAMLLALVACRPNPAFDVHGASASDSASGGATSTGSAPDVTTTTSSSGAAGTAADLTTTADPSTTLVDPSTTTGTTSGTTTSASSTGADDETTGDPPPSECPEDPALVACYPFPPGVLDELADLSPNGHDGALTGVTLADSLAPQYGTAGVFAAMSSDAAVPHHPAWTAPQGTVSLFARFPKVPERKTLVDKGEQYGLFVLDGVLQCIMVLTPPVDGSHVELVDFPVPTDQWLHIACTYDGQEVRLTVHPGGPTLSKAKSYEGALYASQLEVGVGHNVPVGDEDLSGRLDRILFFTRPLSQPELCALAGPLCVE